MQASCCARIEASQQSFGGTIQSIIRFKHGLMCSLSMRGGGRRFPEQALMLVFLSLTLRVSDKSFVYGSLLMGQD